jgi:arginase
MALRAIPHLRIPRNAGIAAAFHSGIVAHATEGSVRLPPTGPIRIKKQVHHADVPFPAFLRQPKTVAVLGAPMIYGQPREGTDFGPAMLREMGLEKELRDLAWEVEDAGDLTIAPPREGDPAMDDGRGNMRFGYCVGRGCQQVYDQVHAAASAGKFALTLGGDHSIGAGTVAGILQARPNTGVVWVDAHADINTPGVSESGNIHGMPVAFLARLVDPQAVPGWEWLADVPPLRPSQLVYIGLRDVDEAERIILRELGITCFTMQHVDRYGIGGVMERTLDQLHGRSAPLPTCKRRRDISRGVMARVARSRPLHCSYDVDAVDPVHAPSTGTAVRGGLTFREANYVVEALSETARAPRHLSESPPRATHWCAHAAARAGG